MVDTHVFGALIPEKKDPRDYTIAMSRAAGVDELPSRYICTLQPVKDQGAVGACVAFSLSSVVESLMYNDRGYAVPISPGYIYMNMAEGDFTGFGRFPDQILKRLQKVGCAPHRDYPHLSEYDYIYRKSIDGITPRWKIGNYYSLDSVEEIRRFIAKEHSYVSATFWANKGISGTISTKSGEFIMDCFPGCENGGSAHQMCIVGYDDNFTSMSGAKGAFLIQNSWGQGWCNGGYAWLLYDHYYKLVSSCWGVEADYRHIMHHSIGTKNYTINNSPHEMDTHSRLIDDCTMMHIRPVTEARGDKVIWDKMKPNEWTIEFRVNDEL